MKPLNALSAPPNTNPQATAHPVRRFLPRRVPGAARGFIYARGLKPTPDTLGRMGNLEVRLAATKRDLHRAQKLRYRVFYKELSAQPDAVTRVRRRDADAYDAICDHLLVLDHDMKERRKPKVVGTYRLLRQDMAALHGGFYTQGEFDIEPLLAARDRDFRFMELGRSCVLKPYRNRRTLELLWQGVWAYARRHQIDAMFGCASFSGTDPQAHALGLSFLHHYALADNDWLVRPHERLRQNMNLMPADAVDPKAALRALPPLIKGYLRVGAKIGDGAVIDHQFGTIDVAVVMPVSEIDARYLSHFGGRAERLVQPGLVAAS